MEEKPKTKPEEQAEERDELEDLDLPAQIAEDVRGGARGRRGPQLGKK